MTVILERDLAALPRVQAPSSVEGETAVFSAFDASLDAACEAARSNDAPILIMTSTRLDGTASCSEH